MIDTTIEIRSTDRKYLAFALRQLLAQIEGDDEKNRGTLSAHNYDAMYMIEPVKQIA